MRDINFINSLEFSVDILFNKADYDTLVFSEVKFLENYTRYQSLNIWFLVAKCDNKIEQISFVRNSTVKFEGKIGIGDKISKVYDYLGDCETQGRIYEPINKEGVLFEVENKRGSDRIESFTIFRPRVFLGVLPSHIADNLKGVKKLP
ncbi:hypothetical protein ISG33_11035 [Glaciecola sp. MH2013]|uniref:hypothetical protein n=1 Tax=Glaciecola sp. MH2013 TaxID=2785524 RepID=UPI00189FA6F8|nr:hypothetical protein [Glaciecola sp. MH2013]MBF7073934.1 hypothetical protein [Glaciecola sp. MH2013]